MWWHHGGRKSVWNTGGTTVRVEDSIEINRPLQEVFNSPNDILLVLQAIADPTYTSPQLSSQMLNLMTATSFEDRLPRPLPEDTRVAHKIGSWESTYSDAGIVFPKGTSRVDQGYYVVVFSEGTTEAEARETIHEVSLAAYRALAEPDVQNTYAQTLD